MKNIVLFFSLLLALALPAKTNAETVSVSKNEALQIAQSYFTDMDVDYFIATDTTSSTEWIIFVDAEPMKGWEHDCYLITIDKASESTQSSPQVSIQQMQFPPNMDFEPAFVKMRAKGQPYTINLPTPQNVNNPHANHTYAVIISGGVNKNSNYERYWRDCSFIYQTLTKTYAIPKSNIYAIMADGDNPAADMRCFDGSFISQPLDLDADGSDEVIYEASKANIQSALSHINNKIERDDHVLVFVTDHGLHDSRSSICLWGSINEANNKLYGNELAGFIAPILEKGAYINIVLGECHSGGLIADLAAPGVTVSAACGEYELSFASKDGLFDEFLYHWTSAINGKTPDGRRVLTHNYAKGYVGSEDAFLYAKENDTRNETPCFSSSLEIVGEQLAFDHMPTPVDLYIQDNEADSGKEPNISTNFFYNSPSLWTRHQPDGIYIHQTPIIQYGRKKSHIYARIHNRGRYNYEGGQFIAVKWKYLASSTGTLKPNIGTQEGVTEWKEIPPINAGEYKDVYFAWDIPDICKTNVASQTTLCLYAKISNEPNTLFFFDSYIEGSNNLAAKKITVVNRSRCSELFLLAADLKFHNSDVSLAFRPQEDMDSNFFNIANIEVEVSKSNLASDVLLNEEVSDAPYLVEETNSNKVKAYFRNSREKLSLKNISVDTTSCLAARLHFLSYGDSPNTTNYTINMELCDSVNNILDGQTIIIESPGIAVQEVMVSQKKSLLGTTLTANADDFCSISWYNSKGICIGDGESILITNAATVTLVTAVATDIDGNIAYRTVSVNRMPSIKSLSLSTNRILSLEFSDITKESSVRITSVNNPSVQIIHNINDGVESCIIDLTMLSLGYYTLEYFLEGNKVESRTIQIK